MLRLSERRNMLKHLMALVLVLMIPCIPAMAAEDDDWSMDELPEYRQTAEPAETPMPESDDKADTGSDSDSQMSEITAVDGAFPVLNERGFLPEGEFVYENPEEGVWRYASPELKIEIYRRTQDSPKQVWYEAEVWCGGNEFPHMIPNDPEKRFSSTEFPYKIARKNGTVLAISSDYAHLRKQQKSKMGIILRDGEILSDKTWGKNSSHFPNLDCLAISPDGDMQVYWSNEKTAEEYAEAGMRDVLSFGPWLIRDGELNETALKKYGKSRAQRTAVGMVEKGHYFLMMLEGRIDRSKGDGISFLAERMLDRGCRIAFNLDGGQTSSIVFMGHQLCKMVNRNANVASRRTAEILGVGTSDALPDIDASW